MINMNSRQLNFDGEIYDKLKKSILQYAIQGKLVPQDSNDEPAAVLLERIRAEKKAQLGKKYVESYIYKGDDNCYYEHINGKDVDITEEIPYDLPIGWIWERLRNITEIIGDGIHGTPNFDDNGKYYFINGNNLVGGKIVLKDSTKKVSENEFLLHRKPLTLNTILLSINGTLGNIAYYNNEPIILGKSACYISLSKDISKEYVRVVLETKSFPKCGSSMYANRIRWTKKDGTYKEVMYYACSRNKQERGHYCDYSANLKKTDIEPLVIEFIKELVQDEHFAVEIKKKIGLQVDTTKIDTEIRNYESKLKEVELNKARLEREIDSLPIETAHRERKLHDMTLRLDALYDTIVEIEEKVEDAKLRRKSVEAEFITMENIYKILEHFGELYDIISDEEKKELIATLVKEIQIYPEGESDTPLESMKFNFPVYKDGQEVNEIFLNKRTNVETLAVLSRKR